MCCVSVGNTADAKLTRVPVNTLTEAGTSVALRCRTDLVSWSEAQIAWIRSLTTSNDWIVDFNCRLNPTFPQYNVTSTSAGQCDLVINNASVALAATYRCVDGDFNAANAELTVIGELIVSVNKLLGMFHAS